MGSDSFLHPYFCKEYYSTRLSGLFQPFIVAIPIRKEVRGSDHIYSLISKIKRISKFAILSIHKPSTWTKNTQTSKVLKYKMWFFPILFLFSDFLN